MDISTRLHSEAGSIVCSLYSYAPFGIWRFGEIDLLTISSTDSREKISLRPGLIQPTVSERAKTGKIDKKAESERKKKRESNPFRRARRPRRSVIYIEAAKFMPGNSRRCDPPTQVSCNTPSYRRTFRAVDKASFILRTSVWIHLHLRESSRYERDTRGHTRG